MCFDYDYEGTVLTHERRRARKEHRCTNWACRRPIAKGDQYQYVAYVCDGSAFTEKFCERCLYYQALIYAEEISEGCSPRESWCAMEEIYEWMRDHGWKVPEPREVVAQ